MKKSPKPIDFNVNFTPIKSNRNEVKLHSNLNFTLKIAMIRGIAEISHIIGKRYRKNIENSFRFR